MKINKPFMAEKRNIIMNNDINVLYEIIGGSKEYSFSGTILTLTGYHTGKTIKIDLSKINKEILNMIMAEDEEEDEEDEDDDWDED